MSGTRVLSSPLQLQGVLGTSASGKSCRAYSSLNKQGCQTCPDTKNHFDACRWGTRVVWEVEYWWKRASDHCKVTWNSFKTHQHDILHSLTAVASRRLCKLQIKLIQNRAARHALTPGIYFDARSWRMRALSEMDWWKRVGDHWLHSQLKLQPKYIKMISLIAWYSLRPQINKCYVQTAQATLQATPL